MSCALDCLCHLAVGVRLTDCCHQSCLAHEPANLLVIHDNAAYLFQPHLNYKRTCFAAKRVKVLFDEKNILLVGGCAKLTILFGPQPPVVAAWTHLHQLTQIARHSFKAICPNGTIDDLEALGGR